MKIGDRVRLDYPLNYLPKHFIPQGATGTVVDIVPNTIDGKSVLSPSVAWDRLDGQKGTVMAKTTWESLARITTIASKADHFDVVVNGVIMLWSEFVIDYPRDGYGDILDAINVEGGRYVRDGLVVRRF